MVVSILGFTACNSIEYDGEYSKDGYYNADNQAYFYFEKPEDAKRSFLFTGKADNIQTYKLEIPIRMAGAFSEKPLDFEVEVDPISTAKSGIHYEALQKEYQIPAGKKEMILPITLIRKHLSEKHNDSIRLVIKLKPTKQLGVRFSELNKVTIDMDNSYTKPDFWGPLETYWGLGAYHIAKHKKLLQLYNGDTKPIYDGLSGTNENAMYQLYYKVQDVIAYFKAHPEELK